VVPAPGRDRDAREKDNVAELARVIRGWGDKVLLWGCAAGDRHVRGRRDGQCLGDELFGTVRRFSRPTGDALSVAEALWEGRRLMPSSARRHVVDLRLDRRTCRSEASNSEEGAPMGSAIGTHMVISDRVEDLYKEC